MCVDPMLKLHANVTLLTNAYVARLETDPSGRSVKTVHVTRHGQPETYSADIVVVACGALSSALLLLRSTSDKHPPTVSPTGPTSWAATTCATP